jgi:hypothetical protein
VFLYNSILPVQQENDSSDLFTSPILAAHAQMVSMGAKVFPLTHRQQQDANMSQGMPLPQVDIFFDTSVPAKNFLISKPMRQLTRQDCSTQWMQLQSPILQHVKRAIQADSSLRADTAHLWKCEIERPHERFDIPPDKVLSFRPTALFGNILSMINLEFSSYKWDTSCD